MTSRPRGRRSWASRQLSPTPVKEGALGRISGQDQGSVVGLRRLGGPPQPPQHVGPGYVQWVVGPEVETIDGGQARLRPLPPAHPAAPLHPPHPAPPPAPHPS